MLKSKPPQSSFYGSYLYDKIVPQDHLLRKINSVVDFSKSPVWKLSFTRG